MVSGARQPGKLVPWTCFEEWQWVMNALYSEDPLQVRKGYEMVRLWAYRGRIPTAVEATGNLAMLRLELNARLGPFHQDFDECQDSIDDDDVDTLMIDTLHTLQLAATMALVRFVNEMVDPGQKGSYAQPITRLAEQIGLPRQLVDLRHSGTHDELPSLGVLQLSVDQALTWLHTHYWLSISNWRATLRGKCTAVLQRLIEELGETRLRLQAEPSTTAQQEEQRLMRVVSKVLNSVEHLELSHQVQEEFSAALSDCCGLDAQAKEMVVRCLTSWTSGQFSLTVAVDTSSVDDATPKENISTEALLQDTDTVLQRLAERKRLKLAASTVSGWEAVHDWKPRDLGAPINFLDHVQ
jgi:hypothetical protein